jgi:hypothetical protein
MRTTARWIAIGCGLVLGIGLTGLDSLTGLDHLTRLDNLTGLDDLTRLDNLTRLAKLTDREFWQLSVDASEPNGYFRSDNLTSNELGYERVIPELLTRTRPGAAYLGVGPEQNFTYMAATRPAIAFIFDIRRGNLHVQLLYKALFELARNRAEFISMLFSKPRPAGLGPESSVVELFSAFGTSESDEMLFQQNLKAVQERLAMHHALPLSMEDREGVEHVYRVFYDRGFAVRFSPTYADLMTQTDGAGKFRSYLASESGFAFLRDLEAQNLVIPIVGDFAGPKAIRTVGGYLKAHGSTVAAFYLSNVEQYLEGSKWAAFCRNAATLPLDRSSTFIRSSSGRGSVFGPGFVSSLGSMAAETKNCPTT